MSYNYRSIQYNKRTYNVDARARDPLKYPNSNCFQISFNTQNLQDVNYVKLLDAQIPNTQYNINEYNNGFSLVDNEIQYDILIPPCNYDIDELITTLEDLLNNLGATNTYNVSIECGKLTFTASGGVLPFELLFATGPYADCIVCSSNRTRSEISKNKGAQDVLGFNIQDYTGTNTDPSIITAPNIVNLSGEPYILLVLETNQVFNDVMTPGSSTAPDAFFKIPLSVDNGCVQFFKNDYQTVKTFAPTIKDLKFLNIKFYTFYNKLYEFQGHNPSITLEIGTLK